MSDKDYYAILGVLPSIDQAALQAVYRALLKKYHPDVFKGNKAEAERITRELNEAYSVLGNEHTRQKYDKDREASESKSGDYPRQSRTDDDARDASVHFSEAWLYISEYYPEAEMHRKELAKISNSLALEFQIRLINNRAFSSLSADRTLLLQSFLVRYFGTSKVIHDFVLDAIINKRTDVAKEINKAILYTGTPKDADAFIAAVSKKMSWLTQFDLDMRKTRIEDEKATPYIILLLLFGFIVFALSVGVR